MEEITFLDVLTHYQVKLKEISEEIETIRNQIKKAEVHMDAGWTGEAAAACRLKLETVNHELGKTLAEMSEAQVKLSAITEAWTEETSVVI